MTELEATHLPLMFKSSLRLWIRGGTYWVGVEQKIELDCLWLVCHPSPHPIESSNQHYVGVGSPNIDDLAIKQTPRQSLLGKSNNFLLKWTTK